MSAPSTGSANGSPVPGYYPDPSIPGYIRYWNGSSWVPGTSRPAPGPGEPAPPPPAEAGGGLPATRGAEPASEPPDDEEDDSDEIDLGRAATSSSLPEVRRSGEIAPAGAAPEVTDWDDPRRLHGDQPQAASAWQADPSQQPGFGDDSRPDLSWGAPPADHATGATPGADADSGADLAADSGADAAVARRNAPDHTTAIRMPRPQSPEGGAQGPAQPEHTVGLRRSDVFHYGASGTPAAGAGAETPPHQPGRPQAPAQDSSQPQAPDQGRQQPYPPGQPQQYAGQPAAQSPPAQGWEQQVHDLAQQAGPGQAGFTQGVPHQQPAAPGAPGTPAAPGAPGAPAAPAAPGGVAAPGAAGPLGAPAGPGAAPWRPPAANPFAEAAQDARPAGLGKRLAARVVDGLLAYAVAGAVAIPFIGKATEHIQGKIEAANQAGVTRTIWLVDGTTGVYLAVVLGTFLLFGLLYEALPTAKWGRTLGKKLFGLRVLDIERQDTPGFGAALRRWLTFSVLSLVVVGVVNAMWCLFDRPWRQCWHDKLARTFVAGR